MKERIVVKRPEKKEVKFSKDFYEDSIQNYIKSLERERDLKLAEKERILAKLTKEAESYKKKEADAEETFFEKIFTRLAGLGGGALLGLLICSLLAAKFPEFGEKIGVRTRIEHQIEKHHFLTEEERELIEELQKEVNYSTILEVEALESVNEEEKNKLVQDRKNFKILGFENFKIPEDTIREIVQTLPVGMVNNISSISYEDKLQKMPDIYGKNVGQFEVAHVEGKERKIVFTKKAEDNQTEWLLGDVLLHEAAHLSDWTTNSLLTKKERLTLLKRIIERVKSSDRYNSSYVEEIRNDDPIVEKERKAVEYFAEIVEAYLSGDYVKLPKADKDLVKNLIQKLDPSFDRHDAFMKRMAIIREVESKSTKNIS